jgi:hypothetical protein
VYVCVRRSTCSRSEEEGPRGARATSPNPGREPSRDTRRDMPARWEGESLQKDRRRANRLGPSTSHRRARVAFWRHGERGGRRWDGGGGRT